LEGLEICAVTPNQLPDIAYILPVSVVPVKKQPVSKQSANHNYF
jgi:hypothetical protein